MAYWDSADLIARIPQETVLQTLDEDHDGTIDALPLARLQADSDSYVKGFLRGIYDLDIIEADPPNEVVRLSLDVAEWMLARRWPHYLGGDWEKKRDYTRSELLDLRNGVTRLDVVGSPEPAANEGGTLASNDPTATTAPAFIFNSSMGDF